MPPSPREKVWRGKLLLLIALFHQVAHTGGMIQLPLADAQARAIWNSIAKAGNPDIANYLLHNWFPRKSCEFIARAYEASKSKGALCILEMLDYEKTQLHKYGSWYCLPSRIRRALS